ncbi:membrane protein insertion efficiency factor YidD [Candidatus Dependentiae bacterium]
MRKLSQKTDTKLPLLTKLLHAILTILKFIDKMCRYFLLFLIRGLRPLLGPAHCKHPISCTDYAQEQLTNRYLFPAIWLITKRVLSCNPFMNPK